MLPTCQHICKKSSSSHKKSEMYMYICFTSYHGNEMGLPSGDPSAGVYVMLDGSRSLAYSPCDHTRNCEPTWYTTVKCYKVTIKWVETYWLDMMDISQVILEMAFSLANMTTVCFRTWECLNAIVLRQDLWSAYKTYPLPFIQMSLDNVITQAGWVAVSIRAVLVGTLEWVALHLEVVRVTY